MKCGNERFWVVMASMWMVSACAVDTPSLESLTCTGNAMTPEALCVDGQWVARPGGVVEPADMDMTMPDGGEDMPVDLDMMPDLPDLPDMPDLPDLKDMCSEERIATLCDSVMCGEPEALTSMCPDARCMTTCQADQQCVNNECIRCLEFGSPQDLQMTADEKLCQQAADRIFEMAGEAADIKCGVDAAPAAEICGLTRDLDCEGVCPGSMRCGDSGSCCLSDVQLEMRCKALSVVERCGLAPAVEQVRSCSTGGLVPLGDLCAESCPLDEGRALLGSPVRGASGFIGGHEAFPGMVEPLSASSIEFWLRPSDVYFLPSNGIWRAVTGADMGDRVDATLYDGGAAILSSDTDPSLRRAVTNSMDQDLNFNHYVDLGGGFVDFARPPSFSGDVSIFMVMRNKFGDEADTVDNDFWYTRPAVLSGEQSGDDDFGITYNQGKLEWNRNGNDEPVFTTADTFASGQWHVLSLTRINDNRVQGGTRLFIDGAIKGSGKTPEGDFTNPIVRIGRHPEPLTDQGQWHGDVAEVILMSAALDEDERRRVHTYLAIKYGITLEDDYYGANDQRLYDVSTDGAHNIFGVMCDRNNFAITQHSSRAPNGLWQLHAGNTYTGLGSCPTSSFSIIMGDDNAPLTANSSTVTYTSQGVDYDLEVTERTWTMRIDAQGSAPVFTMTLDQNQSEFMAADFAPEMVLLEDGNGEQLIVPLQVTADARFMAVSWIALGTSSLDLSTPIEVKLARFER